MNKRILIHLVVGMIVLASFVGVIVLYSGKDIVAMVNGQTITKNELYKAMVSQNGKQVLNNLIILKIVDLEAEKNKIVVDQQEIKAKLAELEQSYGGEAALMSALQSSGQTMDDLKKNLETNQKIEKLINPQVTDAEIAAYFKENKGQYGQAEQVKASHILVDTKELAADIEKKLAQGQDFAQLAKQYSTDDSNKAKGGELGYFKKGQMAEAFEKAVFAMKVGEISQPVQTQYGYHIIKLEDKIPAQEAKLEDCKDKIKATLVEQKVQEAADSWLQKKYAEYKIETFLE